MRIRQMRTHQRRSQFAKSPVISWSSPWPTCISWLCWLVGEVACISLLYLYTQVFQGIFWLMTYSIASPVTDQWLRFEVPSSLISEGFWGILLMAQDDQNGLLVSLALFLNWVMTWFTVDSGMDRFLDICCWLASASSWPIILPSENLCSKEPGNWGMLIHSVVHYSTIYSIF